MNQHKHSPHQPKPPSEAAHGPYWQRAHRDWRFWVGVVMVVLAMTVFVSTGNLGFRTRIQRAAPSTPGR